MNFWFKENEEYDITLLREMLCEHGLCNVNQFISAFGTNDLQNYLHDIFSSDLAHILWLQDSRSYVGWQSWHIKWCYFNQKKANKPNDRWTIVGRRQNYGWTKQAKPGKL